MLSISKISLAVIPQPPPYHSSNNTNNNKRTTHTIFPVKSLAYYTRATHSSHTLHGNTEKHIRRLCYTSRLLEAVETFNHMLLSEESIPSLTTCAILLSSLARGNRHELAFSVYRVMTEAALIGTSFSFIFLGHLCNGLGLPIPSVSVGDSQWFGTIMAISVTWSMAARSFRSWRMIIVGETGNALLGGLCNWNEWSWRPL